LPCFLITAVFAWPMPLLVKAHCSATNTIILRTIKTGEGAGRTTPPSPAASNLISARQAMSADEIAGAFAQHYYGTLDSNIAGLGALYVRREG
jgi:hypothetical protein